jgi:phosphoribosylformylglycinamidine synthase
MAEVNALVITGYGTNCERETAYAAMEAGADKADIRFFSDLASGRTRLDDYNFLIFPGGFLDGDDLGAAQAAALRWRHAKTQSGEPIIDQLKRLFEDGGLVLGICNGFQLLVKLGLLPAVGGEYFSRQVSLSLNDMARFEDRWVGLKVNADSPCIFTRGLEWLELPVRHGEGKMTPGNSAMLSEIAAENLIALQYADPNTREPTEEYPYNPNGSPMAVAGLTDPSGRILGLMPHPEAYNHRTNHPGWTRGKSATPGVEIIRNGVRHLKEG